MIPLLLGSGSSAHGGKAVNETICLFQNCWGAPTGDDCLGSLASYQCVRNARGMSAMPPIPTESMRHNKTSRGAISGLMHRSKIALLSFRRRLASQVAKQRKNMVSAQNRARARQLHQVR